MAFVTGNEERNLVSIGAQGNTEGTSETKVSELEVAFFVD